MPSNLPTLIVYLSDRNKKKIQKIAKSSGMATGALLRDLINKCIRTYEVTYGKIDIEERMEIEE